MKPSRFAILLLVMLALAFLARFGGAAQNRTADAQAASAPASAPGFPLSASALARP